MGGLPPPKQIPSFRHSLNLSSNSWIAKSLVLCYVLNVFDVKRGKTQKAPLLEDNSTAFQLAYHKRLCRHKRNTYKMLVPFSLADPPTPPYYSSSFELIILYSFNILPKVTVHNRVTSVESIILHSTLLKQNSIESIILHSTSFVWFPFESIILHSFGLHLNR